MHEITATNLKNLDRMCDQFLKKWLNIPQSGSPAMLHTKSALNIRSLEHIYRECHAIAHTTSRMEADSVVNAALTLKLQYEQQWTRKGSISASCENKMQEAKRLDSPGNPMV